MLHLLLIICSYLGLARGQCTDLTNPSTGVSDCASRAYLCSNAVYYSLMTTQCPATCGRCSSSTTVTSTTCVDLTNPNTGVSDCPSRTAYCTNSAYIALMRVQCPRTCGFCTSTSVITVSSTCVDLTNPSTGVSDCSSRTAYCTNSAYIALMRVQCPRTCGFCSSTATSAATTTVTSSSTCVDRINANTGTSDCPGISYLCTNSAYATLMRTQCPLTCGYCFG